MARVVLVADDSPTIQKIAVGILKGEGFDVETVSNGVAAIKRLAVLHPVAILADVSMPGRDGYEVCEFVKKSAEFSHVPVLLVASDMEPYDSARGMEVGADGIIKKPFEAQELIATVVKFAEQFEAEAPTVITPSVPSSEPEAVALETSQEFVISGNAPDDATSEAPPVAPDFSSFPEGVAFIEPSAGTTPEVPDESPAAEIEWSYSAPQTETEIPHEPAPVPEFIGTVSAPDSQSVSAEEGPLPLEEPHASDSLAPPVLTPSLAEIPARIEEATPEPPFSLEEGEPPPEFSVAAVELPAADFSAPIETAEPAWKSETMLPPATESAGTAALQPQLENESPVINSPEFPVESYPETPSIANVETVISLSSFSLEDAAAGQVQFASEPREVAPTEAAQPAPPEDKRSAEEGASSEPVLETASTEASPAEATVEPAPPEAHAEPVASPPVFDRGLIYSVVHEAVARMSPPLLPVEVVEEMARRLADEIAAKISTGSFPPQS